MYFHPTSKPAPFRAHTTAASLRSSIARARRLNGRGKTKKALTGTLAKTQYADKRLCLSSIKLQKKFFFVKPFFNFFEYFFLPYEAQKHEILAVI